ncbi:hypothetical protein [Bradyrhizobium sp. MOS002]|uniref:hypothetical protein n=1 Tax=Bradyrhizobium sp. MOS002 TaxID=2133947 RepID=UPI0011B286B8|nr:hypothetical protein [Bradyrhizobium sp. MOS002]
MNPSPLPDMPPPLPPYLSERHALKRASKAAGALVAALIIGMLSGADKPSAPTPSAAAPAVAALFVSAAVEAAEPTAKDCDVKDLPMRLRKLCWQAMGGKPSSPCSDWEHKLPPRNPSHAEFTAWRLALTAKMNDPQWVKCMSDKYGALLDSPR